ncbi:MAG: SDR family NAD(P)-dependent oxidoreductase [Candidatus Aminicenantales bacterium]
MAVVTGAASGIGLATTQTLAEAGARVALVDIREEQGKKALKEMERENLQVKFYRCDVTSRADCRQTSEMIYQEWGRIDILVNNAGVIKRKNAVDLSEEEWDEVLNVNLKAVYLMSHFILPYMIEQGSGCVVNIGSGWGLKGGPEAVAYCAAKGGVVNLTRAMAIDHGQHNIRVNCICPGDVETPLLHEEARQLREEESEFMRKAAERPLQRVGRPEDIAKAVLYLASDLAGWVTGAVLVVDGGGLA